ncbi:tRNA uridine(34) 5-carboxymethylaminomethyl modification radical SAM/GNAT enzyme Elp3 [Candidatus Woesearchaeota archaeon]|nr:tRNA uridine(34) 5-carboxymethylaminomethyl modification radical SAM/GNAT enzyme Elp3 [Candidatus Woesearchaeota archaeon]
MGSSLYSEIEKAIRRQKPSAEALEKLKIRLSRKYGAEKIPSNIEIFLNAKKGGRLNIMTKPTRTLSGIASISIMSNPYGCPHGKCTFCPGGPKSAFGDVPQSYTGKEPAAMRAIRNGFDPYLQVFSRLEQYAVLGQAFDKVELIIQGGTFPSMPAEYQEEFISNAYRAMNDFSRQFIGRNGIRIQKFKKFFELPGDYKNEARVRKVKEKIVSLKNKKNTSLDSEKKRNETAAVRCIGLTIETKPDWGLLKEGNRMLRLGCTRVELGVQSVYEAPLKLTNRGHTLKDTIESIRTLKDLGFKINAHYMLGLPGVKREKELAGLKELFENPRFKPDMLKIYPLLVIKGTPLYLQWKKGQYKPISTEEAAEIIAEAKRFFPKWVRVMRVNRDIPTHVTSAGIDRTNLRQYVLKIQQQKGIKCNCIRCREIGRKGWSGKSEITATEYDASEGKEFFIAAEDPVNDAIIGFCRLRFPSLQLRREITQATAIIRELHVYAPAVAIGKKAEKAKMQHRGFGKELMSKAEEIAKKHGMKKMLVISGIGAKEYYKKLGYGYDGPYMGKKL